MILNIVKGILGEAKGIIGAVVKDPNQAAELESKIETLMIQKGSEAEVEEIKGKTAIMTAELNQGDLFTKRARPTIVYTGLAIAVLNHMILPWIAWLAGFFMKMDVILPTINMPSEFWLAWGGVVGLYAYSRSREKISVNSGR